MKNILFICSLCLVLCTPRAYSQEPKTSADSIMSDYLLDSLSGYVLDEDDRHEIDSLTRRYHKGKISKSAYSDDTLDIYSRNHLAVQVATEISKDDMEKKADLGRQIVQEYQDHQSSSHTFRIIGILCGLLAVIIGLVRRNMKSNN